MIIKKISNHKNYVRKVEGMGEGLVLFEVSSLEKRVGQNYHLFYADKRKPPLDIAINPFDGTIEYISYFALDEIIVDGSINEEIVHDTERLCITNVDFDEDNTHITIESGFNFIKSENDIWILKKDIKKKKLTTYSIDESNKLIFSGNDFCGLILKNLKKEEFQEIHNSRCLL